MVGGIKSTDFTGFPLADFGVTVSRTPVTKVLLNNGDESLVDGTPENVTAILNPKINKYTIDKLGLQKMTDAYIMFSPSQSMAKDDKITYSGTTWRVINVISRGVPGGTTALYKFSELSLVS